MKRFTFPLSPLLWLVLLPYAYSPASAQGPANSDDKSWSHLSEDTKNSLRARWSADKVEEVLAALRRGNDLPSFVATIPLSEADIKRLRSYDWNPDHVSSRDLRGIPLHRQDLHRLRLPFACLDGANLSNADLRDIDLFEAKLQSANLTEAKLQGADLTRAALQGANLNGTELQRTDLGGADLEEADLSYADLEGADLFEANLKSANFSHANLKDAVLSGANMHDADLFNATFDWTHLWRANFGEAKNIRYVVWGGKVSFRITEKTLEDLKSDRLPKDLIDQLGPLINQEFEDETQFLAALTQTLGSERAAQYRDAIASYALATQESTSFRIGEEKHMKFPQDYQNAAITYRDLETSYQHEMLDNVAAEFNFRENEIETEASIWPLRVFRTVFYKWTYGYGSKPLWLLWYSLGVISVFTVLFVLLTISPRRHSGVYIVGERVGARADEKNPRRQRLQFRDGLIFIECFYFSLLSFTTCGFDILQPRQWLEFFRLRPVRYEPVGWARILVGIEAAFGIYVLALLLTAIVGNR